MSYHTPKEGKKKDFFFGGGGGEWEGGKWWGGELPCLFTSLLLKILNYISQLLATVYHKFTRISTKTKQKKMTNTIKTNPFRM